MGKTPYHQDTIIIKNTGFVICEPRAPSLASRLTRVTRKQISLARQIADIFDRYIAYRPEWAVAWSEGKAAPNLTFEDGNP